MNINLDLPPPYRFVMLYVDPISSDWKIVLGFDKSEPTMKFLGEGTHKNPQTALHLAVSHLEELRERELQLLTARKNVPAPPTNVDELFSLLNL